MLIEISVLAQADNNTGQSWLDNHILEALKRELRRRGLDVISATAERHKPEPKFQKGKKA